METIKKYPKLTFEQKMQMKLGTSYEYLLYLKQATPENAVILYPDSKDFREKGAHSPKTSITKSTPPVSCIPVN